MVNMPRKPWSPSHTSIYFFVPLKLSSYIKSQANKKAMFWTFPFWNVCLVYFSLYNRFEKGLKWKERTMNLGDMHDRLYVTVNACLRFTGSDLRISLKLPLLCELSYICFHSFARCQGFVVITTFSRNLFH